VEEFLDGRPLKEQAKARNKILLLQELGLEIQYPHARPLKDHKPLWELRPLPNRILYVAASGRRFILLHAFSKKRRRTPRKEIKIAEERWIDFQERDR
jgi:phage-related protein